MNSFDALLLVSFGGPEGPDDVMPFLENVLRGRNVPQERKLEVAKNYEMFGGISPINPFMRELKQKLITALKEKNISLPLYWGNRNWGPYIKDELSIMHRDGMTRALAFVTSAYSSYSGCRQYREDIEKARQSLDGKAPDVFKIRAYYNHPHFIRANAENIRSAMSSLSAKEREGHRLIFTAHSIPLSMSSTSDYEAELNETAGLIAEELKISDWILAYQSRSGPPTQPWLEPSILDVIDEQSKQRVECVTIAPIGFVSDHMEVMYDLDFQAKQLAEEKGIKFLRSKTAGHHPLFIEMIVDLILERLDPSREKQSVGTRGPKADLCPVDCCQMSRAHG